MRSSFETVLLQTLKSCHQYCQNHNCRKLSVYSAIINKILCLQCEEDFVQCLVINHQKYFHLQVLQLADPSGHAV